jgi:hypothetical protein
MKVFICTVLAFLFMNIPQVAHAQKTLIVSKGEKYEPGLAKSWSSAGAGKLVFQLDTSKEVARGKKLSTDLVKKNIEEKLGAGLGASVKVVSADKIEVSYKGAESEFLKQLAKLRIRPESDVKLAAGGTVSDTGIRAKIAARDAADGEAKVKIISSSAGISEALVVQAGKDGLPKELKINAKVKLSGLTGENLQSSIILVRFGAQESGVWKVEEVK